MHRHLKYSPLAAAIAALVIGHGATAQQAALEEITVTAQKREQSLKDVPISVNVVDASRLEAGNINKLADLTEFVPNLSIAETAVSTQLYIRGIGSGNNQGFEQSVGQYVDGVYYSRQMLMRAPYLDLSRVEVLRGPQSTLFGKNSIAGALNYTTARPTREFEAKIDYLHEGESNQNELTGVLSGPLSDTLRGRFAFRGYREDGYIHNTFSNADEPRRNERTYRGTLDWDATDKLDVSLKIERNNFDTHGRQVELVRDDANALPAGSSPLAGKNTAQILAMFGQPAMDTQLDFNRQVNSPEQSINHIDNHTLSLNYQLGDLKLTAITGHLRYDFREECDCDYTPTNLFSVSLGETYSQWSQELRVASPTGGKFEWLGGAYWQKADMSSLEVLNVPYDSFIKTLALTSTDPSRRALAAVAGSKVWRDNGQSGSTQAAFFQGTWKLTDDLRLTVGGRYTHEDKDGYRRMNVRDYNTLAPLTDGNAARVLFGAFRIYTEQLKGLVLAPGVVGVGHNLSGSRKENQFTPMVNLQWDANAHSMVYASVSSGYKAGGFDGRANNPYVFEFDNEKAKSYEVGAKNFFFDRALELNIAYFYTDYRNLQVSQFDGVFGFNVGNAKKARTQGIELDGRWAITDGWTLGYSYAWLDFKFTDFQNGNCYNGQTPNGVTLSNGVHMCDYTGLGGQYTPTNSASLSLDYKRQLDSRWLLLGSVMANFRGSEMIHDNHDPHMQQPGVTRIDLRVGVEDKHWRAAFVGKNLANQKVLSYAGNVPLTYSLFGTSTYFAFVERPRQLALDLGYTF